VELPTTTVSVDKIEILIKNKNDNSPENKIELQDITFNSHTVLRPNEDSIKNSMNTIFDKLVDNSKIIKVGLFNVHTYDDIMELLNFLSEYNKRISMIE